MAAEELAADLAAYDAATDKGDFPTLPRTDAADDEADDSWNPPNAPILGGAATPPPRDMPTLGGTDARLPPPIPPPPPPPPADDPGDSGDVASDNSSDLTSVHSTARDTTTPQAIGDILRHLLSRTARMSRDFDGFRSELDSIRELAEGVGSQIATTQLDANRLRDQVTTATSAIDSELERSRKTIVEQWSTVTTSIDTDRRATLDAFNNVKSEFITLAATTESKIDTATAALDKQSAALDKQSMAITKSIAAAEKLAVEAIRKAAAESTSTLTTATADLKTADELCRTTQASLRTTQDEVCTACQHAERHLQNRLSSSTAAPAPVALEPHTQPPPPMANAAPAPAPAPDAAPAPAPPLEPATANPAPAPPPALSSPAPAPQPLTRDPPERWAFGTIRDYGHCDSSNEGYPSELEDDGRDREQFPTDRQLQEEENLEWARTAHHREELPPSHPGRGRGTTFNQDLPPSHPGRGRGMTFNRTSAASRRLRWGRSRMDPPRKGRPFATRTPLAARRPRPLRRPHVKRTHRARKHPNAAPSS